MEGQWLPGEMGGKVGGAGASWGDPPPPQILQAQPGAGDRHVPKGPASCLSILPHQQEGKLRHGRVNGGACPRSGGSVGDEAACSPPMGLSGWVPGCRQPCRGVFRQPQCGSGSVTPCLAAACSCLPCAGGKVLFIQSPNGMRPGLGTHQLQPGSRWDCWGCAVGGKSDLVPGMLSW